MKEFDGNEGQVFFTSIIAYVTIKYKLVTSFKKKFLPYQSAIEVVQSHFGINSIYTRTRLLIAFLQTNQLPWSDVISQNQFSSA